jgi:hypothetical protein
VPVGVLEGKVSGMFTNCDSSTVHGICSNSRLSC